MDVKIYTDGAARGNPDGPGGELYRNLDTESVRNHLELLNQEDGKKKDERRQKDGKRKKKNTEKKTSSGNVKSGKSSDNRKEADSNER